MPQRIQRQRTPGWTAPLDDHGRRPIYVGRPTRYANPFRIVHERGRWVVRVDRAEGVRPRFIGDFESKLQARQVATREYGTQFWTPGGAEQAEFFVGRLRGRDLMCWCELPEPGEPDWCHAAVLLRLANAEVTA